MRGQVSNLQNLTVSEEKVNRQTYHYMIKKKKKAAMDRAICTDGRDTPQNGSRKGGVRTKLFLGRVMEAVSQV